VTRLNNQRFSFERRNWGYRCRCRNRVGQFSRDVSAAGVQPATSRRDPLCLGRRLCTIAGGSAAPSTSCEA